MEWAIAAAVFVLAMAAMIAALPPMKSKSRKGGGFAVGLFMIFASVFDPARAASVEQLARKKDIGDAEEGESGEKP